MTGTGKITVACPAMKVFARQPDGSPWVDETGTPQPKWHKTAKLQTDVTLERYGPGVYFTKVGWITFPETWVKPTGFMVWQVDQCKAIGHMEDGSQIWNLLPPEPVSLHARWGWPPWYLIAAKIVADGGIAFVDGSTATMKPVYPDAPSYYKSPGVYEVQAVTATDENVVFQ